MILLADSEGPDQSARMRRLIWAFAVRIYPKACVPMAHPKYNLHYGAVRENVLRPLKVNHEQNDNCYIQHTDFTGFTNDGSNIFGTIEICSRHE